MNVSSYRERFIFPGDCLRYRALLFASILASLLVVAGIIYVIHLPSDTLEKAREAGIVSRTILDNYNDREESLKYELALLAAPLLTWLFFSVVYRLFPDRKGGGAQEARAAKGSPETGSEAQQVRRTRRVLLFFLKYVLPALVLVWITYDPNFCSRWFTAGDLMIDEGCHLAWINEILSGKVLYKDSFYLYGPLTTYPAAYLMKLFGTHIFVWRSYVLWATIIGLLILFYSLAPFGLTWAGRWAAMAFMGILYYPVLPGFTWVSMRLALGLLAIALFLVHVNSRRPFPLIASGAATSAAFFFSQEIGLAAAIMIGAGMLLLELQGFSRTRLARRLLLFVGGLAPLTVMVLAFFYLRESLSAFVFGLFSGPRYFLMGWGALTFPNFAHDLFLTWQQPTASQLFQFIKRDVAFYFPLTLYLWLLCSSWIRIVQGTCGIDDLPDLCLLGFGIILFNSALARSDEPHILFVSLPAVILSIKHLGIVFAEYRREGRRSLMFGLPSGGWLILGLISLLATNQAGIKITALKNRLTGRSPYILELPENEDAKAEFGVLQSERGKGLHVPLPYATSIDEAVAFIRERTTPEETVFAFPNEAAFYFLTGRANATSFVLSQLMITRAQRQEAVAQLRLQRPRYVIFGSLLNTRIDQIPTEQENPEVLKYIQEHFRLVKDLPGIQIGERIPES